MALLHDNSMNFTHQGLFACILKKYVNKKCIKRFVPQMMSLESESVGSEDYKSEKNKMKIILSLKEATPL